MHSEKVQQVGRHRSNSTGMQPNQGTRGLAGKTHASVSDSATSVGTTNDTGLNSWDPTNWVEPAKHNKTSFRLLAIAGVVAIAASSSNMISSRWAAFVHLLSYAVWFGSNFWTTFVAGITMYKNLPRQTFGNLQSKLFPKYFQVATATTLTGLATLKTIGAPSSTFITLGVALFCSILNLVWLEPCATDVMFERYKLENEGASQHKEKISSLKKQFGKWHGISSLANLVALCAAVSHGFWLATRL